MILIYLNTSVKYDSLPAQRQSTDATSVEDLKKTIHI